MFSKVLSVTEINLYIKRVIDNDYILKNSIITGEISNLKLHSSGHIYFTLKDENSKISAIMFRDDAEGLKFMPKDGMKVEVKGRISVYSKDGAYQVYVKEMKVHGVGDLYQAFEELKIKLSKEGLFDEKNKKSLPPLPRKVAVVTAPTGAAVRDIINVIKRRNKYIDIKIFPTLVQGISAAENIKDAIEKANKEKGIDAIILARGGGSIEELWAFNEEAVAYAIFNSSIPIITGVGHETDFTISDFISDRRAPTPSAAAEILVPRYDDFLSNIDYYRERLENIITNKLNREKNKVELLTSRVKNYNPTAYIANQYSIIDSMKIRLTKAVENNIEINKHKLNTLTNILQANSPLGILNKGYSIIRDTKGQVIDSKETLEKEKRVEIIFKSDSAFINIECGDSDGK